MNAGQPCALWLDHLIWSERSLNANRRAAGNTALMKDSQRPFEPFSVLTFDKMWASSRLHVVMLRFSVTGKEKFPVSSWSVICRVVGTSLKTNTRSDELLPFKLCSFYSKLAKIKMMKWFSLFLNGLLLCCVTLWRPLWWQCVHSLWGGSVTRWTVTRSFYLLYCVWLLLKKRMHCLFASCILFLMLLLLNGRSGLVSCFHPNRCRSPAESSASSMAPPPAVSGFNCCKCL